MLHFLQVCYERSYWGNYQIAMMTDTILVYADAMVVLTIPRLKVLIVSTGI